MKCKICNKESHKKITCSKKCLYKLRSENSKGNKNYNKNNFWTKEQKDAARIKRTEICLYDKFGNKEIYPPIPITCQCKNIHCNEIVYGGKEYKIGHHRIGKIGLRGELSSSKRPEVRDKIRKSMSGELNPSYIDGRSYDPYCKMFNNSLKEKIRVRDAHICQLCGKTQLENGKRLSVHHIHYDKQNCYPDLICLCRSCNCKVDFNCSYFEQLFMNKLNDRKLLFWTIRNINFRI